jgi:CHAD domain-containing protein
LIYTRLSIVRSYQEIIDHATIKQLHLLRIDIKRLRYTLEFFREVLGDEAKGLIDLLKVTQDHLGELHDSDVACQWLAQFLNNWESQELSLTLTERRNPEPVVDYLAYRHAERHHWLVTFPDIWTRLNHPKFYSDVAKAISIL